MAIHTRIIGAVAGLALSAAGIACSQSMPVTDELQQKWSDKTFFDLKTDTLEGKPVDLSEWKVFTRVLLPAVLPPASVFET